jgi:hypothetical protein
MNGLLLYPNFYFITRDSVRFFSIHKPDYFGQPVAERFF